MSEPPEDRWIGRELDGRYRIDGVLGAGGLGQVYRATHLAIEREVAVKILHAAMLADEGLQKRFAREVKVLSRLAHPNIVSIVDSGAVDDNVTYLVMEMLEGHTLEQRLDEDGLLPVNEALEVTRQVLRGLAGAHESGVLHRDIKPANVFLQPLSTGTHVKLLDFGLAKPDPSQAQGESTLTGQGIAIGTPSYMSPEQAGLEPVSEASDLYAVGVLLFEMLTGAPPFDGETKLEILRAHLERDPPTLREASEGFEPPEGLQALLDRALAKAPTDRFASAQDMLAEVDTIVGDGPRPSAAPRTSRSPDPTMELGESALEELETHQPGEPSEPELEVEAARPPPPKTKSASGLRWVLAVLVLAGGGAAAYLATLPSGGPEPTPIEAGDETAELEQDLEAERAQDVANPFTVGSLPPQLRAARRRVVRGRTLDASMVTTLNAYQQNHPDDPRPSLLLARHHRLRGRFVPMTAQYADAYDRSADAVGFEPMLRDLIDALRDESAHADALETLQRTHGAAALPELEVQLAEPLSTEDRERLETAQRALR